MNQPVFEPGARPTRSVPLMPTGVSRSVPSREISIV
jgi:hypothetical protein